MITVWGRPNSANVKKVLWTLEELAIDYDNIKIGGHYGGLDDAEYLALNPNGLIPTIKDKDVILWESNTIVRYLAARYGKDRLWIEDCAARAQAEKWMDWTSSVLYKPFQNLIQHGVRMPEDKRDPEIIALNIINFEMGLAILEEALGQKTWLSGDQFGIGDIITGTLVYYYYGIEAQHNKCFYKVENWYARLKERPAYVKTVMLPIT